MCQIAFILELYHIFISFSAFTLSAKLQLACLPHRRRDIVLNGESNNLFVPMEGFDQTLEVSSNGEKKNRKGLFNWFKLRVYKSDTL
jgi:hypothetical protein